MPRTATASRTLAAGILVALLILRVIVAIVVAPMPVADAAGYDAAAIRLAKSGVYSYPARELTTVDGRITITPAGLAALMSAPPNAYTMPGYPAFLALVYRVVGTGESRLLWARIAQALLSVVTAALVYLIGRRYSEKIGLTALAFAAVYPPFTLANSYLLTEVLYATLLTLFIWLFLRWLDARRIGWALAAGAALAAGLWVRPVMAVWIVGAGILILILEARDRRRLFGQLVAMALVTVLLLSPWWVRNYRLYHRVVLFGTYNAVNVIEGFRRDVANQMRFPWQSGAPSYSATDRAIAAEIGRIYAGSPPPPTSDLALGDYYSRESHALTQSLASQHPALIAFARLRSTVVSVFWPDAVSPTAAGGVPFTASWLIHLGLLALFVVGAFTMRRTRDTAILVSVPVYFLVFHAAILPLHRYYFPALPVALVISAGGFWAVAQWARRRLSRQAGPSGGALG